MCENSLKLTTN